MTFAQATAQVQAARDAVPLAVASAIDQVGELAAARVSDAWPVATGRSAAAWTWIGTAVANTVPYVSEVHQGLADDLVPRVLSDLEGTFRELVEARINAAGGWDG